MARRQDTPNSYSKPNACTTQLFRPTITSSRDSWKTEAGRERGGERDRGRLKDWRFLAIFFSF